MNPQINEVLSVKPEGFLPLALKVFKFQYHSIPVYKSYVDSLGVVPEKISKLHDIPFLPIQFFKSLSVKPEGEFERIFESSRTTGTQASTRYVMNSALYQASFLTTFRMFYGMPREFCILALLPSYLEQENSSLVYMANQFIQMSNHPKSGFYRDNLNELAVVIRENEKNQQPTLVIGVSYALLELAKHHSMPLKKTILMETGGMKGKMKEMTKQELHSILMEAFELPSIHAEYGMTELYSQAYSPGEGKYFCPPWMHAMIRETTDPFSYRKPGKTGGLNIIDLANLDSVSFIETQDLARMNQTGSFEIMGRFDQAEVRGCNLMDPLNQ